MPPGRLITFEGGEGAGKSTQIAHLAKWLARTGLTVTTTREPGGTPGAEALREILLQGEADRWLPMTEMLLLLAARYDHVVRRIRPALAAGRWVLCDRFSDSTRVYQGIAGALGVDLVDDLQRLVLADPPPDLSLILDVPVAVGLARRQGTRAGHHRYEAMDHAFHERVRAGFLDLAKREPERCIVIDAARPMAAVAADVRRIVATRFRLELADDDG